MVTSAAAQEHTALVKVQGPFTRRQMESIADGMVYLKKLGLVSVIVIDGEGWSQSGFAAEFDPTTGILFEGGEAQSQNREDLELEPWTGGHAATRAKQQRRAAAMRRRHVSLRSAMLTEVQALSDMLQERGAATRPFLGPLMRVDVDAAKQAELTAPRHFPGTRPTSATISGAEAAQSGQAAPSASHSSSQPAAPAAFGYQPMQASTSRSPLVSDDALSALRSALATDHIPIVAPLALYADPEEKGAERSVPVRADDVLVALARDMAIAGRDDAQEDSGQGLGPGDVDLMPVRLMVINREGGIPSHARGGNPHLAINLASEYSHITKSFIWGHSHPTSLSNLATVHDCLSYMPHTSSGIVVSHRSPRSLIANLITNKAAHSPSLPHALLASRQDVRHTPTIVRPGLPIRVIEDLAGVDWRKLTALLEASFGRQLNGDAYYERLRQRFDFLIVTGDYQGAAIVTRESAPDDEAETEPIAYLDKFAVLPQLQGSGTVDFLWGALRDEVQGLGLLDALNDNGGKGGFGRGRDLVWKSRADNPVNRWYYERSNGFAKIDTTPKELRASRTEEQLRQGRNWVMFWCDAEERLSRMSGERRLGAEASPEDVLSSNLLDDEPMRGGSDSISGGFFTARHYDADDGLYHDADRDPTRSSSPRSPFQQRLSQLDPRPGGGSQRLLPVIAPEEEGRLERWAKCMSGIPSAWK